MGNSLWLLKAALPFRRLVFPAKTSFCRNDGTLYVPENLNPNFKSVKPYQIKGYEHSQKAKERILQTALSVSTPSFL